MNDDVGGRSTVRTANKVWSGIATGALCLVAAGGLSGHGTTAASLAAASTSSTTSDSEPTRNTVTVTDVIAGDTFVASGQTIRVLGIDSCAPGTSGGQEAKALAASMLQGSKVTLRSQPGVETDSSGHLLRYVDLAYGGDFGEFMVVYDHTGATQNGAAKDYVASLRRDDPNGRTCARTTTTSYDGGASVNWPAPA